MLDIVYDGTKTIRQAIAQYEGHKYPQDSVVMISEPVAMLSGGGWYVGRWCLSTLSGVDLYPEPYSRDTEYCSKEEAISLAKKWREEDDE